jgi:hypothetical protein
MSGGTVKEYRVVDEFPLEKNVNEAARDGFKAVLMSTDGQGLVTVLMEKEVADPNVAKRK